MKIEITIGGITYVRDGGLKIGDAVTFCGSGSIRASAIRRYSKNRYKVTVISDSDVWTRAYGTVTESVKYLREQYGEQGTLLSGSC